MSEIMRPILEIAVIIPGMLLAYLPVKACLRQAPFKLGLWMFPLLLGISLSGGIVCYYFQIMTTLFLIPVLLFLMLLYHKTLQISIWKSSSIFLAVCAVFACVKSLSRAVNAIMIFEPDIAEKQLWLCVKAGIFYNLICLSFVLIAWYPATHMVRILIADENFAQTWYIFWILPLIFIGLNQFMVPKYQSILYTGRILQIYVVVSIVLLIILTLFYAIFLMMALSLNKNARLQQENHFLSLQQARYENLCSAIEEARQARHDIRHHFLRLLKRQDRYVTISGIIIFSWLHWQKKVIWKKLKNIFPVPTEKCQVLISISAIIRLWTVYLDIIRIMQNKKVFLFWHRLIFQITFWGMRWIYV